MIDMDEEALQITISEMATFRPECDAHVIRCRIEDWLKTGQEPLSEAAQDIIFSYWRTLDRRAQSLLRTLGTAPSQVYGRPTAFV